MPDVREVYEMITKQKPPEPGALERQQKRQVRAARNSKIGAFAVVVAIGLVIAAAWALWAGGGHSLRTPAAPAPTIVPTGSDRVGLVGLAPENATPSQPTKGHLVLDLVFGHTMGDPGRVSVHVYADGRLIWQRIGHTSEGTYGTGLLQQRLTPQGVDLLRAEALSTGLFDHDLNWTNGQGLNYGRIDVLVGDRLVHIAWGGPDDFGEGVVRVPPTSEQASALQRLDGALEDPASWLPASAWSDPKIRAYVPSGYSVCYNGKRGADLSQVLAALPPAARDLLLTQDRTRGEAPTLAYWCSDLTTEESHALAANLDNAGREGHADEFGLSYGSGTDFIQFSPLLPHQT
jgi:hypothetical protein